VRCPRCKGRLEVSEHRWACANCKIEGSATPFFDTVQDQELSDLHRQELTAQAHAVGEYYENEAKFSCFFDRFQATALPELLGFPKGEILDLGCATGTAGAALRGKDARVTGVDLARPCLEVARSRLDLVVRADVAHLPFADHTFDALVARGTLHHVQAPEATIREAARVLKPGAPALFIDPRAFAPIEWLKRRLRAKDPSFADNHRAFTGEEYGALLRAEFRIAQIQTMQPAGVLVAAGLDLLSTPSVLGRSWVAQNLVALDDRLQSTTLRRFGHLLCAQAFAR
jgi:SAM-dependent methyltransferase